MWELRQANVKDIQVVAALLEDNCEPFAVTIDPMSGYATIWFRKEVEVAKQEQAGTEEIPKKILPKKRRKAKD